MTKPTTIRYKPSDESGLSPKVLIANHGTPEERSLLFHNRVEIGRDLQVANVPMGKILVADKAVSSRHCVVTQEPGGRCYVRDVSRNGTRIDGRRLIPNVESEILLGQILSIGHKAEFVLKDQQESNATRSDMSEVAGETVHIKMEPIQVTVLVGDIRDYTRLVQSAPSRQLQGSVVRVFNTLEQEVRQNGGILKEYQGDAIFAYWESGPNPEHASDACRGALALSRLVLRLAEDPKIWDLRGFPLGMDWCLASGEVRVETVGGTNPTGLSMIGEPVVLAFRLEKLVSEETGNIIVAESTWRAARDRFEFVDRGEAQVAGFEQPQRFFSLSGESVDDNEPP